MVNPPMRSVQPSTLNFLYKFQMYIMGKYFCGNDFLGNQIFFLGRHVEHCPSCTKKHFVHINSSSQYHGIFFRSHRGTLNSQTYNPRFMSMFTQVCSCSYFSPIQSTLLNHPQSCIRYPIEKEISHTGTPLSHPT